MGRSKRVAVALLAALAVGAPGREVLADGYLSGKVIQLYTDSYYVAVVLDNPPDPNDIDCNPALQTGYVIWEKTDPNGDANPMHVDMYAMALTAYTLRIPINFYALDGPNCIGDFALVVNGHLTTQ